jgi:hypothetical protein
MENMLNPEMVRELASLVASIAALIAALNAMRKPR